MSVSRRTLLRAGAALDIGEPARMRLSAVDRRGAVVDRVTRAR